MNALMKIIDNIEEVFIFLLLAFMTIMNFINVVSRYLFSNSFSFTEELTIMAFVWVTMLGVAAGYKRAAHLGMSYLVDRFPKKARAIMAAFSMICSIVMIVILIIYGIQMVQGQIRLGAKTPALKLPSAMQGLSIPVGGVFIAIHTLEAGIKEFLKIWRGEDEEGKEAAQ